MDHPLWRAVLDVLVARQINLTSVAGKTTLAVNTGLLTTELGTGLGSIVGASATSTEDPKASVTLLQTTAAAASTGQTNSIPATTSVPATLSATPSATTSASGGKGGISTGAKAGIAVGVVLGVLILAGLLFFFMRSRRNNFEAEKQDLSEQGVSKLNSNPPATGAYVPKEKETVVGHELPAPDAAVVELPSAENNEYKKDPIIAELPSAAAYKNGYNHQPAQELDTQTPTHQQRGVPQENHVPSTFIKQSRAGPVESHLPGTSHESEDADASSPAVQPAATEAESNSSSAEPAPAKPTIKDMELAWLEKEEARLKKRKEELLAEKGKE